MPMCVMSCASTTVISRECAFAQVITLSRDDALTDDTARQVLRHNKLTEEICK